MRKPPYWTVQFFPAGGGRVRALRVPRRLAHLVAAASCAAVLLFLVWLFGFFGERHALADLERLRVENAELRRGLEAAEARTLRLGHAMDALAARDQRYRILAGLPVLDPDVQAVGVGGPGSPEVAAAGLEAEASAETRAVRLDLEQLLRRTELLAASLEEATDSLATRREAFLARPSITPVASPEAWFSSGFSLSRLHPLLGYRRPHPGIDISAPAGSPVVATARGRIVSAGREAGYGLLVEVEHGFGYRTRYAHLARIHARPGQRVERGDVIAEVGRSGLATGPNLHYEVLVDGDPVNPWGYLLDRPSYHPHP